MSRNLVIQLQFLLGIIVVGMFVYTTKVNFGNGRGYGSIRGKGSCCDETPLIGPNAQGDHFSTSYISTENGIKALEDYVKALGENFKLKEVMEFQNNFYAVVVESDTGMGAFEILLWKSNGRISREPGPNMMWNLKYGMHPTLMEGRYNPSIQEVQAVGIAENYLKYKFPGRGIEIEEPISFYGYYTMDFKLDEEMYGMLSVNAFTGNIWYHSWHGTFLSEIEMDERRGF